MSIYKACDIRGLYPDEFSEANAERVGKALGAIAAGRAAVVAGDVRLSTPALKARLTAGLLSTGAQVVDLGTVPTPLFTYAVDEMDPAVGAMVTASHNPPEFNGVKLVVGGQVTTPEVMARVQTLAEGGSSPTGEGTVVARDMTPPYEAFLCDAAQAWLAHDRRARVVVDAGNGCMAETAPRVFRRLGFDVVPLFCEPDGRFPNRDPNPSVAESLTALSRAVCDHGADLGVAFDGDGDRAVFVDDAGAVVPSECAAILLAREILRDRPGRNVVYDLKSTQALPECVEAAGGEALMERSGYAFIKARMRREAAVFGAEVSGHFFYGFLNGRDDGLLSALYVAALVAREREPLSAQVRRLPRYAITPDVRVPRNPAQVAEALRRIKATATGRLCELDGVRVDYPEGWGLARSSVTEPLITLRFEARTEGDLRTVVERFLEAEPGLAWAVARKLGWEGIQ